MTLSIIIINFNGEKYISNCLVSVLEKCQGIDYEIIVVDNDSKDGSLAILKNKYNKHVKIIENKKNVGFAKGNNIGVSKSQGKYILLLNNDTVLLDNLKSALEVLQEDQFGVLGVKMLGEKKEYRYSTGHFPSALRLLKLSWLYNKKRDFATGYFQNSLYMVDWIEGSFLMTKREIWNMVDGMDDEYFMYAEDMDYCKRVSSLNYNVVFYPECKYIHYGGYGQSREYLLKKGFEIYLWKFHRGLYKRLCLFSLAVNFKIKDVKNTIKKVASSIRKNLSYRPRNT